MHLNSVHLRLNQGPALDRYPFNLPVLRRTGRLRFTAPVTFFAGENGTGKSTLLRAVAKKCGIHMWKDAEGTRFERNPFADTLFRFVDVAWANGPVPGSYFDAEVYRDFAEYVDQWAAADPGFLDYFGGRSLMAQSHGQSLLAFFTARYRIRGLYLLDEPETALSPNSQIRLLRLLAKAGQRGDAQFVIATHSPILLACPGAAIYSFDRIPAAPVAYEETDHYRVYRDFMADPASFV